MAFLSPQDVPDTEWVALPPNRAYAVKCDKEDTVHFRFGQSHGIYFAFTPVPGGLLANLLDYEKGEATLIGKINEGTPSLLGRTSECGIKIMHAIISRQHMALQFEGNILVVTDLGSTNGSFIHTQSVRFDIEEYVTAHPPQKGRESTMDAIHEAFGPALDDFLMSYLAQERNKTV